MSAFRISTLVGSLLTSASLAQVPNQGYASNFEGTGYQGGGCGVPDEVLWKEAADTLTGQANPFDYVALNVFNSPGVYSPEGSLLDSKGNTPANILGTWEDGLNCGRWVEVELGDSCSGNMEGHAGQPFCGDGGWYPDSRNGARLNMMVNDRCADAVGWCRDSRYHLDLHSWSLNRFRKDGELIIPLVKQVFSGGQPVHDQSNPLAFKFDPGRNAANRKISWNYIPAPNYQGEPRFYFKAGAKSYYRPLIVTHLPNGLHKVEQDIGNGSWKTLERVSGAWQAFRVEEVFPIRVRLWDANDQLVMQNRTWSFDFPKSCGSECTSTGTPVDNLKGTGGSTAIVPRAANRSVRVSATDRGWRLSLPAGSGEAMVCDLSGRILVSVSVRSGLATLPALGHGLHGVHWKLDSGTGSASFILP